MKRDETLVGFWDIKNATLLNGYYRELRATAYQLDTGVSVKHRFNTGAWSHEVVTLVQRQTQALDYSGPQSISQFEINIASPEWPTDLTRLTLRPRTLQERYVESGIAIADTIHISPQLEARIGLRRSSIHIDTASNTALASPTADVVHTTVSAALAWHFSAQSKAWLSRAESLSRLFEPVRGQMRLGGFLPAQTGTQWELGWKTQVQHHQLVLSAFDIRQSNLPGTPQDLGSLRVSKAMPAIGVVTWLQPFWVGKRPADAAGSLYAPGFVRWDAGASLQHGNWHWSMAIENALDKRYVQAISAADNVWQGPRRRLALGMRVSL